MAKRTIKNIQIGELVKWYELYADGFMTKDYGSGVVIKINTHDYGFADGPYRMYAVYRNKHKDIMPFRAEELELIK